MRIVHLYKDYHPPVRGGIEQTVERMAREQVAAGHHVTVITSAHRGRKTIDEVVDGVRVVRVAEWGRIASAPLCPATPVHVSRQQADVWHMHFPSPTGEVSWLLARPRGALAVTYHSDIVRQAAALRVYRPVIHAVLARAGVIMPTSQAYIERSEFLRAHRARCHVVPLGIDLDRFASTTESEREAAALRARMAGPITLFVGRLRYYKGVAFLVEAMVKAPGTLVIVGDGPERETLESQARALGISERVIFMGDVSDVGLVAAIAAADAGVLPSTHPSEALGIALIEMMAGGLPVISTELGTGTSFVNEHEKTGYVVPPRNADALAAALTRLHASDALRRRFGEAGRARANEVFSTRAMMQGVARGYEIARDRTAGRHAAG